MAAAITVVLDESCAHLKDAVGAFAEVSVFSRKEGFRCASSVAAKQFHQELVANGIVGRAIYVAPSFAGFTALLVASEFPRSLGGLLLVDPSHPHQGPDALKILVDAPPSAELDRLRVLLAGFGGAWDRSCAEVAAIHPLGAVALHVMAGGKFDLMRELPEDIKTRLMRSRHAMLLGYCQLSSRASFEIVEAAGHDLAHQTPDAVIAAIKRLRETVERDEAPC